MRIWTIQPAGLYETLKTRGLLFADGRRHGRYYQDAYRWMIDQMRRRLPPSRGRFPWWGWYRWQGAPRPRPDLRAGGHLRQGEKGVRLEIEMDAGQVLLSDYDAWHFVLGNWFLSQDEAEDEQFDREKKEAGHKHNGPWPEPLRTIVRTSWQRIFDLTAGDPEWRGRVSNRAIQATFWELRLEDVRDATFFTDRGRRL